MAIDNFIPEIFVNEILLALKQVSTAVSLCNRKYDGLIQRKGDTVHIPSLVSLAIDDYDGTDITYGTPSDSKTTLTIDTAKYIAGTIDDLKQSVSPFDLAKMYLEDGQDLLTDAADQKIYEVMAAGAHADNTINTITLTKSNIVDTIEEARKRLSLSKVAPSADTFIALTPEEVSMLRRSSDFVKATEMSDQMLITGQVGKIYGFRVIETTNVFEQDPAVITTGNDVHRLIPFGVVNATAFATAIPASSVEIMRAPKRFATDFRALHFYGCKVLRPKAMGVIKADTGVDGTA